MIALRLSKCVSAWESIYFHDKALLSPSMRVIVQSTIQHLKELESIKDKEVGNEVSKADRP